MRTDNLNQRQQKN